MIFIPILFTLAVGYFTFTDKHQAKTTLEIYRENLSSKK